ncbi:hypothetical protein [Flavobacterium sp. ENC]|uniref:hypothetical protein n=1 Tax=Flavobacterium sp. ENC TaxID=2897330 RepID=UPI001E336503|nr:hypothetical protein [Flavobacterium sp. ENC]MCD0465085.1 hypothetical protein [Flavobacterium sp. ENC]
MKKHLAITFWALYMLFFAIPFPMFMYYAINSEFDTTTLKDKNPYMALGYLALSLILWLILLIGYFKKWILQIFITRNTLEKIKKTGVQREAKIINVVKISKPKAKFTTYELELCFKNLSDTEIKHKATITDAKPHERRFETGKKINLLLNRDMDHLPHFIIASATATLNLRSLVVSILGWTILTAAVLAYYVFSYRFESYGMGWRFMCIGHPLIICPLTLLFYRNLVQFIFRKLTGLHDDAAVIKFKGIKTQARLIKVSQTGTYINEQPMMRFELEFTDHKHHVHKSSLKKIIGLLELDLTKKDHIDIFYVPDNPAQIAFANDLNNVV